MIQPEPPKTPPMTKVWWRVSRKGNLRRTVRVFAKLAYDAWREASPELQSSQGQCPAFFEVVCWIDPKQSE